MRAFLVWVHTRLSRLPATLAAAVAASLLSTPPAVVASTCPDLFPKATCFERIDANTVTIFFGVDNFLNQSITPSVNFFDPPDFVLPVSFDPGFTPGSSGSPWTSYYSHN